MIELLPSGGIICENNEINDRILSCPKTDFSNFYMTRKNGKVVGYVCLDEDPNLDYIVLYELYIAEKERKKGYGASTLESIELLCIEKMVNKITLTPQSICENTNNKFLTYWYSSKGYLPCKECPTEYEKILT